MAVVLESGDRLESQHQMDAKQSADLEFLSKLNPSAVEFIPSSRKSGVRLSADAPCFDHSSTCNGSNGIIDSSSDGSSGYPQKNLRRRGDYRHPKEEKVRRTVYVSNIDQHVSEEELAELFDVCGKVADCRICGDPHSFLRFAFIEFCAESGAREALKLDRSMLGYYPLRILPSKTAIVPINKKFLPNSDETEMVTRTVYCTNIDKKVSQVEVKCFFEQYCGEVSRLRLLLDKKHSTCIAFIEFAQAESAKLALLYCGMRLGSLLIRVSPSKTPVRSRAPRAMSY